MLLQDLEIRVEYGARFVRPQPVAVDLVRRQPRLEFLVLERPLVRGGELVECLRVFLLEGSGTRERAYRPAQHRNRYASPLQRLVDGRGVPLLGTTFPEHGERPDEIA